MASKSKPSRSKQAVQKKGYDPFDPHNPPGQPEQEETGAASSDLSGQKLPTWGTYEKPYDTPSAAQTDQHQHRDLVQSQKGANIKVSQAERRKSGNADPSVKPTQKQKNEKSSRNSFSKKFGKGANWLFRKGSHNAVLPTDDGDMEAADISQIEEDEMEQQENLSKQQQGKQDEEQLLSPGKDSSEEAVSQLLASNSRLEHELDESKRTLASKEAELGEVKVSLEDFKRRRVEWQDLVDLHKTESEKLRKERDELKLKITEVCLKSEAIEKQLEGKSSEVDKLTKENQNLSLKVTKFEDSKKELHEKETALAAAKKSYKEECSKNSELSQKLDAAEVTIDQLVRNLSELESELNKCKKSLQERSDQVISLLENNTTATTETSKRTQALQDQLSQRDSELTQYKEKLQQLEHRNQEVTQQYQALEMGLSDANTELEQLRMKLEREKQNSKESDLELERVREEKHWKIIEIEQKLKESTKSLEAAQDTAEKLASEKEALLQRQEIERNHLSIKHTEEQKILKDVIADLKHKLEAKTIALDNMMSPPLELQPFPSPDKGEVKLECSLAPKNLTGKKSKSLMQLQSESLEQPSSDVSLHSSAPSSLRKDGHSSAGASHGDQQDETPSEYMNYESPHTSLNEVAGKVTVNEENMTDAVKASIQHEVVVLPNKLQTLQLDNDRLKFDLQSMKKEKLQLEVELKEILTVQMELEAMKSKMSDELRRMKTEESQWLDKLQKLQADNAKLEKIKVRYLDMVQEQVTIEEKVRESESRIIESDLPTESVTKGPLVLLDDKNKRILELTEQLKEVTASNEEMEKKIQQLNQELAANQIGEGIDVEASIDLRQVNKTLASEITSIKSQLSRAESEQSSSDQELFLVKEEMKQLEEEMSKLKMENNQLLRTSQYWKQQCEKRGDDIQSLSEKAESKASQLQDELELCREKDIRNTKEILRMRNSMIMLESRLKNCKQDRDRQHDQIMHLTAVKSGLDKELQHLEKVQVESQHYKQDLIVKIREVNTLQEEKLALIEQVTALKEEIEVKDVEIIGVKEDFKSEREDREKLASRLDSLVARDIVSNQEWKEKLDKAEKQIQYYSNELENSQNDLENSRNVCTRQRQSYERDMRLLTDQIEELRTEHEEKLQLTTDQMKKEADIKLAKLKAETLKETNRLTELLQASKDDFHSQLAGAETEYRELQREYDILLDEKSRMKREIVELKEKYHKIGRDYEDLKQENLEIQTEMTLKNSSLESEKEEIKTKCLELLKHDENNQATIGILQSENEALASRNLELEQQIPQVLDQHAKEKQKLTKQLQNIDIVRKVLKTQLDTELQRSEEAAKVAEESRSEVTLLSRELAGKDQLNCQLQRELKFTQERLSEMEFKNAQMESEMKKMTIQNVGLERERNILHSRRIEGEGQSEVNRQLITERDELEAKYSKLLDDYRMVQQLAIRHGLRIPPRRDEQSPYAKPPLSSDSDVRPFDQDSYHVRPPMQEGSRHYHTTYVSGLGPGYQGQQHLLPPDQGMRSPGSRNRRGSNDPSSIIPENELAQGIDHDIAEAAAHMEEKEIHTTMVSMTDARPLDSNLVCPLCGKQFRIGQIQHYRQHVDNCSKNPI